MLENVLINNNVNTLKETVLLPIDKQSGRTCYHIRGTYHYKTGLGVTAKAPRPVKGPTPNHPLIEVWIDTTTFMVIRITRRYNEGTKSYSDTMVYQPVLNQPVKPEALAFDYKNCQ